MAPSRPPRANVKPLTHWIIHRGYTVRFTDRQSGTVEGILTTPDGPLDFRYDAIQRIVHLPDRSIPINAYGWEIAGADNQYGNVTFDEPPSDES